MTIDAGEVAEVVRDDLIRIIQDTMAGHPRSQQTSLGPSEIGMPCTRRLIHKLAGHPTPPERLDRWMATIGTGMHTYLETAVREHPLNAAVLQPRYLLEQRVHVGDVGGQEVWGNSDLFDIDPGAVVDWKIIGATAMQRYRSKGPGQQYRTQAHLYGRGFQALGLTVNTVMIMFLPRDGELSTHHMWSEPYDETVALAGLSRVNGLHDLLQVMPVDDLLHLYEPCDDFFCPWCTRRTTTIPPGTTTPLPTTAELFAGDNREAIPA